MDQRTENNLKTLDPKAQAIFLPFISEVKKKVFEKYGVDYIAISGNRTWEEQDELYKIGRSKPGRKVTNARGGQSNHNFGIALDFGVFKAGKYLDNNNPSLASKVHNFVGELSRKYRLDWGGDWKLDDEPHFEVETGLSLSQKRERYKKNKSVL